MSRQVSLTEDELKRLADDAAEKAAERTASQSRQLPSTSEIRAIAEPIAELAAQTAVHEASVYWNASLRAVHERVDGKTDEAAVERITDSKISSHIMECSAGKTKKRSVAMTVAIALPASILSLFGIWDLFKRWFGIG
jgi:hypothetical protein